MGRLAGRLRRLAAPALLALGLCAATYPAWRVLRLGDEPTLDELLQLRCTTAPSRAAP